MRRLLGSLGVALLLGGLTVATTHGQIKRVEPVTVGGSAAKGYVPPKTPDGQPDLTGFWTSSTFTPLQRPANVAKAMYTLEEVLAAEKRAVAREDSVTVPGTEDDVHYDDTQFGLGKTQGLFVRNLRTSLITDPPDGRIPALNEQGKARLAAREADLERRGIVITNRTELNNIVGTNTRYDRPQNTSLDDRCIITGQVGPPMVPGGYNSGYQFVQSPGWMMILIENNHIARLIPTDGRPGFPQSVRGWAGISRGRWEGNTLVVTTTNITTDLAFPGNAQPAFWYPMSENMKVTEWFTRVDANTINYKFTVDDPETWTRPWTAEYPFVATEGPIFEHACHEGNRSMTNALTAARMAEKKAAEAAKRGSN
jgi:hypothetical protein